MSDLAAADFATSDVDGARADFSMDGAGGGGGGPCACDGTYIPYCLGPANTDDPDALILGLSPFAYYFMDGATGGTDQTGNGHTATASHGTVTYGVPAITAKNQQGEATAFTLGGGITFPPPVADMSAPAATWSAAMVMRVDAYDSGAGGAPALDGGFPFFSIGGASPPKMGIGLGSTGRLWPWFDSTFGPLGNYSGTRDVMFALGDAHVLVIVARGDGSTEFWLDGVLVITQSRDGTGIDGTVFMVGRLDNGGPFFGAVDMTISNIATWARVLTVAEVADISAALADDAILAAAWTP